LRWDPVTLAATSIRLLLVGIASTLLPAVRATRIAPHLTVRGE
jgi:hypothetical protein